MKMPELRKAEESQSMSAMTDVVFLLLIFFIVTMSSYAEMTLLETQLPTSSSSASNAKPKLENPVRIDIPPPINDQNVYLVNGSSFTGENINILLRRYARLMPDAEFLISCAPDSEHYQLVGLLAHCATHKLKNLKLVNTK